MLKLMLSMIIISYSSLALADVTVTHGNGWTLTDGTNTVNGTTKVTVTGGTVGGTSPNATLTVTGGSGGPGLWQYSQGNIGIDTFVNVGIGSTNPGQALDVQGTIRTQNLTITKNDYLTNAVPVSNTSGDVNWAVNIGNSMADNSWELSEQWGGLTWRPGDTQVVSITPPTQALIIADGYLFEGQSNSGGTCNGKRFNEDNLSVSSSFSLTGCSTGFGGFTFDKTNGLLYAVDFVGNVWQINPITLASTQVITETLVGTQAVGITNDGSNLYIIDPGTTPGIIYKWSIGAFSNTATLTLSSGLNYPNFVEYDGVNVWVVGNSNPAWIAKIPTSLASATTATLTGCNVAANELGIATDYVWVGCEQSNETVKVRKSDLTIFTIATAGISYGTFYDGTYAWNAVGTASNVLERITPNSLETDILPLPSAFAATQPNKIVSDGHRLFVSQWNGGSGTTYLGRISQESQIQSQGFNQNIGIDSFAPGAQLDVVGTVRTNNLTVNNSFTDNGSLTATQVIINNGGGNDAIDFNGTNQVIQDLATNKLVMSVNGTYDLYLNGTTSPTSNGVGNNLFSKPPQDMWDVQGGEVVGYDWAGTNAAPPNGLLVEGNVGIGSVSPGQLLDVHGTIRATGFGFNGSTGTGYVLTDVSGNGTLTMAAGGSGSQSPWTGNINAAGYELYGTGNVGIGSTVPGSILDIQGIIRDFNGNVGIGTSYPGQMLDVQGTVRAIGSIFQNNNWGTETISTATSITPTGLYHFCYMANTQGAGMFTVNNPTNNGLFKGQPLVLVISSTSVQTFSWGNKYKGGSNGLPTTTLGTSTIQYYYFAWDDVNSHWDLVGNPGGFN